MEGKRPKRRRWSLLPAAPVVPLPAPHLDACPVSLRFGTAELMGLLTLYALVFGLLGALPPPVHPPWWVFVGVGLYMALVAIAQPLLFRGTRPRLAAAVVGAVVSGLPMFVFYLRVRIASVLEPWSGTFLASVLMLGVVCCAGVGALLGYATGTLMAGVFLVAKILLGEYRLRPQVTLRPFEPEDRHTLVEWLAHEDVRDSPQWRRAGFPADAREFFRRLETPASATQKARRYKAVDTESERMIGYAEIDLPDTRPPKGRLAFVCVGPDVTQRGMVGLAMVRELLREAFERLELAVVDVVFDQGDWQAGTCYAQAGFQHARLTRGEWLRKGRLPPRRRAWLSRERWQRRYRRAKRPRA